MDKRIDLNKLKENFLKHKGTFDVEDNVKVKFASEIMTPLLNIISPMDSSKFLSEHSYLHGGRADATFKNIVLEYKKGNYFEHQKGIEEALYGRDDKDRGLESYLISHSGIAEDESKDIQTIKLTSNIGIGFDGSQFIFSRFVKNASVLNKLNVAKTEYKGKRIELPVDFTYEILDFHSGLERLILILRQRTKMALTKENLLLSISPEKSEFVRKSIMQIYEIVEDMNSLESQLSRSKTMYNEWDLVFGKLYGNESEETDFTSVSPSIRKLYGISEDKDVNAKYYLFSLQTFFNIFLKLLVNAFLSQLINPLFTSDYKLNSVDIIKLFSGEEPEQNRIVRNFFEVHYLEWFVFAMLPDSKQEKAFTDIVNDVLKLLDEFDLTTFVLKPENIQDVFQEVYMSLIPDNMRHLMGEYFSPDWIVEYVLEMVGYDGDINKTLIDPTGGSGPFVLQALKQIVKNQGGKLTRDKIDQITNRVVLFDINPISVVAAKANYILVVMSTYKGEYDIDFGIGKSIDIPVYIADSVLAPVVYGEENDNTIQVETSVSGFEIPKFSNIHESNTFLRILSDRIHEQSRFEPIWSEIKENTSIDESQKDIVEKLYLKIYQLHMSGLDSFWPIILKNSFAPLIIRNKFDFVVGNPPWIAWKSMSKQYREGTLKVWQSYGIFEKNAYDKKTTHDDFGMAVTYVSIDYYLKENGVMGFLLPATFLKSTKGGEGFRKFEIIRNNQDVPFSVDEVNDFTNVKLFTIPTVAVKFIKNKPMQYPFHNYKVWTQVGGKKTIDNHMPWKDVRESLSVDIISAQPIDKSDKQSAWLTLERDELEIADIITDPQKERVYRGRKGVEPAGAKGIYLLTNVKSKNKGLLEVENNISRQRRKDVIERYNQVVKNTGTKKEIIEETYVYPMLGGRNIERWRIKSHEFIVVPHDEENLYGISEEDLGTKAYRTYNMLAQYREVLLKTRIQNGKFFNEQTQPFYRLDNVGKYTFSKYKVLWKEQTGSMAAVSVSSYYESIDSKEKIFSEDKPILMDSKVLMLDLETSEESFYVSGILNSKLVIHIIDGYAISTNRGVDVLKNIAIPKYDSRNIHHKNVSEISEKIHAIAREKANNSTSEIKNLEQKLNKEVKAIFKIPQK